MVKMDDDMRRFIRGATDRLPPDGARERDFGEMIARREAEKKRCIDNICATMFGVAAGSDSAGHTQFPVVVGVLRSALQTAYDHSTENMTFLMVETMMKNIHLADAKEAAPEKPPEAGD